LKAVLSSLGIMPEEAAYIGDDVNDLDCMKRVGICACPADAVKSIKMISHFIASAKGGRGAVREFIEWLGEQREEDSDT
jgi:3-deoxy-D-manno-octulosonate 8-phosphate phosphatase (KDO 8-P phosphatase)